MKAAVSFALLLLISTISFAQIWQKSTVNTKPNGVMADSVLIVPRDTAPKNNALYLGSPVGDSGRIAFKNGAFWGKDSIWRKLGSNAIDTTSLSTRIDQKLNISDTLSMLSSYLRKVDTTGKWKPLSWFPGVSQVTGLQDSLSDRYTKDQSDARYLQGNQTITLSGDVLGSGTTAITTALKNTGTAGTYTKVTTDAQGRVSSGTTLSAGDIPDLSLDYIPTAQKGASNGVTPLGSDGKVPSIYLPTSGSNYVGIWDASTNTPTLADGTGSAGDYYIVSVAGTQNLGSGSISFDVGDNVVYNGTVWQKVPTTNSVVSVNGKIGIVVIDKSDVGLSNVDNTSDLAKPISTATQTALNGKEATIAAGTTAQYWRGDKTWQTLSTAVRPLFSAGTGLTYNSGTGAFSANFGTTAGTIPQGNDSRINNGQTAFSWGNHAGAGYLTNTSGDARYPQLSGSYANPSWLTSLPWSKITGVPSAFPTSSNLSTVLSNGNAANNSITLGAAGNTNQYSLDLLRTASSVDYRASLSVGTAGQTVLLSRNQSDVAGTRNITLSPTGTTLTFSPNNGSSNYDIWHSNNHPSGSAFTPTLTGANVLASLITNSAGHVTAATTRTLTAGDISAIPSNSPSNVDWNSFNGSQTIAFNSNATNGPNSPSVYFGINIPGYATNIAAQLAMRNGNFHYRTLEGGVYSSWLQVADRSWVTSNFAASSGSGNYIQNQTSTAQSGAGFWTSGSGRSGAYFEVSRDGSSSLQNGFLHTNATRTRGFNIQPNDDTNPGMAIYIHSGTAWVKRQEYFANGDATFYGNVANISFTSGYTVEFSRNSANYIKATSTGGYLNFITNNAASSDATAALTLAANNSATFRGAVTMSSTLGVTTSVTSPILTAPSGNDLNLSAPSGHSIFFNPGGTNKGTFDSDGRLGIGVIPNSLRASLLEVNGNVWATDAYILGTTNSPTAEFGLQGGGTNGSAFLRTMGTGNLDIQTGASNTRIQINGTTGNVGIGMSASSYNLQVAGSMAAGSGLFTVDAFGQVGAPNVTVSNIMSSGAVATDDFTLTDGTHGNGKVLTSDAGGHATWQVPGQKMNVTARQTGNYTVLAADQVVLLNPSGSGFTLTLPSAASSTGRVLWVRNLNTGTTPVNSSISIIGEGGTITAFPAQLTLQIISDGTDWIQIGK